MWKKFANLKLLAKQVCTFGVCPLLYYSTVLTCKSFWQVTFLRAHFPNYFNGFGISVKFCVFLIYCTVPTCAKKEIKSFLKVSSLHGKDLIHVSYFRWTGAGKNYVSRFIAESIFKERLFVPRNGMIDCLTAWSIIFLWTEKKDLFLVWGIKREK